MKITFAREYRKFTKVTIDRPLDQPATPKQLEALHTLTVEEWIEFAHPRNGARPKLAFINSPTLTQLWTTQEREQHVRNRINRIHRKRSRGRRSR
ncbi:MAG: hypothetical protein ACTMIY_09840 [Microbacterium gubbeenense]